MKKWFQKIDFLMIILIIILIIVSYCYAQLKVFHKDHIEFCGYTIFRVITGSMENTIKPQDIVIVKLTKDVNVNDIITYKSGKDFITHRVIEKTEDNLITKGDANTSKDSPITSKDVVGKVVYIFNNVGTWIKGLKTPQVIIAIIFSIITIRIIFGIKPKNKEVQKG